MRKQPRSLGIWLRVAEVGATFWTEQTQASVKATASRAVPHKCVTTTTFYALHPPTQEVVILTRVEIVERMTSTRGNKVARKKEVNL